MKIIPIKAVRKVKIIIFRKFMFIKKNKILKIINKNIDDLEPEIKIINPKKLNTNK